MNVELDLVDHDVDNIAGMDLFVNRTRDILSSCDGKVCVFLENAYLDANSAANLEKLIADGVSPLLAFYICSFSASERLISAFQGACNGKEQKDTLVNLLGVSDWVLGLQALDDVYEKYRDQQGNSRLLILTESNSGDIYPTVESILSRLDEAFEGVKSGNFTSVMDRFKDTIIQIAHKSQLREQRVAEKIASIDDGQIDYLIVRFGAGHTGIRQELLRRGIKPEVLFIDREPKSSIFLFQPLDAAIRKCRFLGSESMTELDWHQALIGLSAKLVLDTINELDDSKGATHSQVCAGVAARFARLFTSMAEVEAFRQSIERTDLIGAMLDV